MTKPDPTTPLRRVHLEQAIAWARRQKHPAIPEKVTYSQKFWCTTASGCGTAFCIHGAAHMIARGIETMSGPELDDYTDCFDDGRAVRVALCSECSSLANIQAAID